MQRLLTGLLVAFFTLALGIAASMLWNSSRESRLSANYPNEAPTTAVYVTETVTETPSVSSSAPATAEVETERAGSSNLVKGGILHGKAVSKPQPAYPPVATAARASGTVVVEVLVDETGGVVSAKSISGHPLLQQAAVDAAKHARFSPTRLSGKPVKVSGTITYNFVLQ